MKRIGVLTSGGDAPGMNTAIRAVVRYAAYADIEVVGIEDGFAGLVGNRAKLLTPRDVGDILQRGGTVLRTARTDEMRTREGWEKAARVLAQHDIEGLVVIGGDGSMNGAHSLAQIDVRVVGIPASIDNDIWGTERALGVDTALNTIMEAVDKLRDTASSHQRAFLIETMGRNCGYLAIAASLICGAELAVVPELETPVEEVAAAITAAYRRGKQHAFVIVAEGASLDAQQISDYLVGEGIGFEPRITTLGHVQRGGSPSASDRLLAVRMGIAAVRTLESGIGGVMVALVGDQITTVDLAQVTSQQRSADTAMAEMVRTLAK